MRETERAFVVIFFSVLSLVATANSNFTQPDSKVSPGYLCTPTDPNFSGYDYPEKIARCVRNVGDAEKTTVGSEYGISKSSWPSYEFDHLIPLCAGGSDDIRNLWPQPLTEAHQKDVIEDEVCIGMKNGTLTQAQAVQKIKAWFASHGVDVLPSVDEN